MNRITRHLGFTLIELMITVAILGILAAVAAPTYNRYLQSARRADARTAVLQTGNQLEKFFSDNLTYTNSLTDLNMPPDSPEGYYSISITTVGPGYAVWARAKSSELQYQDETCRAFSLSHSGSRTASNANGADTTGTCW